MSLFSCKTTPSFRDNVNTLNEKKNPKMGEFSRKNMKILDLQILDHFMSFNGIFQNKTSVTRHPNQDTYIGGSQPKY